MKIADLYESVRVPPIDIEKIVNHMADAYLTHEHWDAYAKKRRPSLRMGDDVWEMMNYWRKELPPELQAKLGTDEYALDNGGAEEVIKTPEFRGLLLNWARARVKIVTDYIEELAIEKDGGIIAHRLITVLPTHWQPQHITLGCFWTYSFKNWEDPNSPWDTDDEAVGPRSAYTIAGTDIRQSFLIEAVVPQSSIDWEHTVMAGMDWYSGDREFELRVKEGAPVNVLKVERYNAYSDFKYPPLNIKGKTFTA